MSIIYKTKKFNVIAHDAPHHDRDNGGHAKISPKEKYGDRTKMPMDLYVAMMKLVMVTGEAIINVMRQKGLDIVRINYQDNGNWSYKPSMRKDPQIHVHLYVRSNNEKHPDGDKRFQAFPEGLIFPPKDDGTGYYENFKPYSNKDISNIKTEIERLLETNKYREIKQEL